MQFAVTDLGSKTEATKGLAGRCGVCSAAAIAKCRRIKVHHWAHTAGDDCDSWSEPETEWHREWKRLFPPDRVEVTMGPHRADIKGPQGNVIELQNSPISPSEIEERQRYYGPMVWVVNGMKFADRFFLLKVMDHAKSLLPFKLKHMRPSWQFAKKPIYLDFWCQTVGTVRDAVECDINEYGSRDKIIRYSGPSTFESEPYYTTISSLERLSPEAFKSSICGAQTTANRLD